MAEKSIDAILSKGDPVAGGRTREVAHHLLGDLKQKLGIAAAPGAARDRALEDFIAEVVLGAAWYSKKTAEASCEVWRYIILNSALVICVPLGLIGLGKLAQQWGALPAQITAVLTGVLALQKTMSSWYASQQRFAAWYKAGSDLKTLYYAFVQTWSGKVTASDEFLNALQAATAAARTIINDEQLDYFQKLALPNFDVLDMLTSTGSTISGLVTSLVPGAPPTTLSVAGRTAMVATSGAPEPPPVVAAVVPPLAAAGKDGAWATLQCPQGLSADVMLLLTDGSVLIHNADNGDIVATKQWMRYFPAADGTYEKGSWAATHSSMQWGREWFASGVLADGRVFAIGGEYCEDPAHTEDAPTGEIYDPGADKWSAINKPAAFDFVCGDCNGTVLADGRVLLGAATPDNAPAWVNRIAIWNPVDGSWKEAGLRNGAQTKNDPFEEETLVLLQDGSVLAAAVQNTPKAERYLPGEDVWVACADSPDPLAITTLNGEDVYETGPAILLPNGKLFYVGGGGNTALFSLGANPHDAGSWQKGPDFPADNSNNAVWPRLTSLDSPACLLPNGKIILAAGSATVQDNDYYSANPVFLIYDPQSPATILPRLDPQPELPNGKLTWSFLFLLLPTGQVLCSMQTDKLLLFTPNPSTPNPAWMPASISFPQSVVRGQSYKLSGTQINGLSQAVCYGDDAGMATNYPIVRLTNPGTGAAVYAKTSAFSTMGVATGSAKHSCMVTIPPKEKMSSGNWELSVIANGISSAPVEVEVT